MSITDELREWACIKVPYKYGHQLTAIADRIDEAHEMALAGQFNSLTVDMEPMTEENMAKGGWMKMPVDADGVPIHIGDVMDNTHKRGFAAKTVIGISYHEGGKMCVRVDEDELRWHDPLKLRHHEPTVEDVLREFAERYLDYEGVGDAGRRGVGDELMDEYAEKLREVVEHEHARLSQER